MYDDVEKQQKLLNDLVEIMVQGMYLSFVINYYQVIYEDEEIYENNKRILIVGIGELDVYVQVYGIVKLVLEKIDVKMEVAI